MPSKREIARLLKRQERAEEAELEAQLQLLYAMRRDTLGALADAGAYRSFHLSSVLRNIDDLVEKYEREAKSSVAGAALDWFANGHELIDAPLAALSFPRADAQAMYGVSREIVAAAQSLTSGEIGKIYGELGDGLKSSIRRLTFGIDDPAQAMKSVADIVTAKRTPFTTAEGDSERIIRTEGNRIFGTAAYDRMRQSNEALDNLLRKCWHGEEDGHIRESHQQACDDYGDDADGIEVDEAFVVDDEELMYPCDPNGSAENTINCRCRLRPSMHALDGGGKPTGGDADQMETE